MPGRNTKIALKAFEQLDIVREKYRDVLAGQLVLKEALEPCVTQVDALRRLLQQHIFVGQDTLVDGRPLLGPPVVAGLNKSEESLLAELEAQSELRGLSEAEEKHMYYLRSKERRNQTAPSSLVPCVVALSSLAGLGAAGLVATRYLSHWGHYLFPLLYRDLFNTYKVKWGTINKKDMNPQNGWRIENDSTLPMTDSEGKFRGTVQELDAQQNMVQSIIKVDHQPAFIANLLENHRVCWVKEQKYYVLKRRETLAVASLSEVLEYAAANQVYYWDALH